jgi:PAS domain S-box-containing protein
MRGASREHVQRDISTRYAAALADYLGGGGEEALTRGYEIGRRAAALGVGLLELVTIHHGAVRNLARAAPHGQALEFLTESLSPYEVSLRAYQANARFLGLAETLAKQNTEIDRAREQLQMILDATTAVIYLKNTEDRFLFVNRQFLSVFQLERSQALGRRARRVLPVEIADVLEANDAQVLSTGKALELEETFSITGVRHTYISLKVPLLDGSGTPHAICCVATDISERKRTDEALRQAKDAADAANRELESFSYSVAHDLRAPLRSIDGYSQAILELPAGELSREGARYLIYVREAAEHMERLIEDLLALSKVTSQGFLREDVDLSKIARDIARGLESAEPAREVELVVQDDVLAHGDAVLLRAVLENLLGNAWKFTRTRDRARIEFGEEENGAEQVFFVRDNGTGFDMAHAKRLFTAFQRLHSADEFEGTGIGLATVERIVRRHGGRVWGEGQRGRGATFHFTLSRSEQEA